jgi:hypothetical protein
VCREDANASDEGLRFENQRWATSIKKSAELTRHGDDGGSRTHQAELRITGAGEAWAVWEDLRTTPIGPSLVFENTKVARRVHEYPANWRDLSDEQLYALSWAR